MRQIDRECRRGYPVPAFCYIPRSAFLTPICRAAAGVIVSVVLASCVKKKDAAKSVAPAQSETAQAEGENQLQPPDDQIAEDCLAFLRATKARPAQPASGECPTCSTEGTEVLRFQQIKTDRISCSGNSCEIAVTLTAAFNPSSGGEISGGLTGWISPEQRAEYLHGHAPAGEQIYRVKITYKRTGEAWRAIEFDRADSR